MPKKKQSKKNPQDSTLRIELDTGKKMPLDKAITVTNPPETLIEVELKTKKAKVIRYDFGDGLDINNYSYHRSHFSSCPQANNWRKKKEANHHDS